MKIKKLPPEEWKLIPDLPYLLEGEFEISNHGRVRHVETHKYFKPSFNVANNLYLVKIAKYGLARKSGVVQKMIYLVRVVWQLFGGEKPANHVLYHINKDRSDNCIWNIGHISKRNNRRRIARLRKEGHYIFKRARRYYHDRTKG